MTKADKGNKVVIMERLGYQNKMDILLNDIGTYKNWIRTLLIKLKISVRKLLKDGK